MTLVVMAVVPLLVGVMGFMGGKVTRLTKQSLEVYEVAAEIASGKLCVCENVESAEGDMRRKHVCWCLNWVELRDFVTEGTQNM